MIAYQLNLDVDIFSEFLHYLRWDPLEEPYIKTLRLYVLCDLPSFSDLENQNHSKL